MDISTFILINFIWNLFPEVVQDKIKEVSVDKAYNFLETAFSEETTIITAFWKAIEKVVSEVYIDTSREDVKYRFQQGLLHPNVKVGVIAFCKQIKISEVSHSLENEHYWKQILEETFRLIDQTEWKLATPSKEYFLAILMAQYTLFKQYFIQNIAENSEESTRVLLATTLETQTNTKHIIAAINKLAQTMIGQVQHVNIQGNNNLVLVDVKGKEISISLQTFLTQYNQLFKQVLYLIEDKKDVPYVQLKTKIEQQIQAKRSELDEYNLHIEAQDLNYMAESSKAIVGKTVQNLDKKALKDLFQTELTKNHLLKQQISQRANVETKLKALFLMTNGYVVKGTYLCLCSAAAMRSINTTADYISFGVYTSKDRTNIKIADEFYGNLVVQFEQVENELILNLGSLQIIDLMARISDYEIPKFVFRELIANAVVHRDYSENARIHTTVELYQDRFVVRNPGAFPSHINPNDLENIQSKPINKEIARIFFLHNIVQKRGSGIQRVQSILKERGMQAAIFEEKDGIVSVTVYRKESKIQLLEKAQAYHSSREYSKELEYRLKALVIDEQTLSLTDKELATSYNNLGKIYRALGDLPKSLEYRLKALEIFEKTLSPEHTDLAIAYNYVAGTYQALGNLPKSLEYGLKALEIFEKNLSPEHPDLATLYNNIASTYEALGNFPKSLEYLLKALGIRSKNSVDGHPSLATSYRNIAVIYYSLQNWDLALSYMQKAILSNIQVLPIGHYHIKDMLQFMSNILATAKGKLSEEVYEKYEKWLDGLLTNMLK